VVGPTAIGHGLVRPQSLHHRATGRHQEPAHDGAKPRLQPCQGAAPSSAAHFRKNDPVAWPGLDYGYTIVPSQSTKTQRSPAG